MATLSSSTKIIGAPVSLVRSTQQQCIMADNVNALTEHRVVITFLTAEGKQFERLGQSSHPNTDHEGLEGEQKHSSTLDVGGWSKTRPRFGQRGR
jgi:hypothetical protein